MSADAAAAPAPRRARRALFAPEVVQTSAMDCGPASLKCLLEGFGVSVSYGRLREACQTDVDGTSIDTLEEITGQLGLDAEQVILPVDHVLLPAADALPALVVVRLPNGFTHFVVLWRRAGAYVQVMDPGMGRRWIRAERFLRDLYVHAMAVPAAAWREWAGSDNALGAFAHRLARLGLAPAAAAQLASEAAQDPTHAALAALDAAARMTETLARAGGVARGAEAAALVRELYARAREDAAVTTTTTAARARDGEPAEAAPAVPWTYWYARPAPPDEDGEPQLEVRGAVLLRITGVRDRGAGAAAPPASPDDETAAAPPPEERAAPMLRAALEERPVSPWRELARVFAADGATAPATLAAAIGAAALAAALEAVLLRGLLELGRWLPLGRQRLAAALALLVLCAALLALELPIVALGQRLGRRLENRFRLLFLSKIPRLGDRYLQSRPASDMAARSHAVHQLRQLPAVAAQLLRAGAELFVTAAAVALLDPPHAPHVAALALGSVLAPLALQPVLTERELRARVHAGALSRFDLDALLGVTAVRAHAAERAVRREHESLLVEWARAARAALRAAVAAEGATTLLGTAAAAWLFLDYVRRTADARGVLLVLYWLLILPALGQEIAQLVRRYPAQRNTTLRLLEPLGAPDEDPAAAAHGAEDAPSPTTTTTTTTTTADRPARGVALAFRGVGVVAAGHAVLEQVDLAVAPGEHVAVVGPSGAGKSSLVGLLLGWHRPAAGTITVDGAPLDGARLAQLRRETAWVDPAVQLWNRSLLENLTYGAPDPDDLGRVGEAVAAADLRGLLERLPEGLQTSVGDGGGLLSGGEGQRVRLARALARPDARLVVLDEPFRGLARGQRAALLARVRAAFPRATLLCITHDIRETLGFARVLVIEAGRLVEDGAPAALAAQPGSRFGAMLAAEDALREQVWQRGPWRRMYLDDGVVAEARAPSPPSSSSSSSLPETPPPRPRGTDRERDDG